MSKKTTDAESVAFHIRHGLNAPKPQGIKRQGDPSRLTVAEFWQIQNARISGSQIRSRGGQTKVNSVAESGCIVGIFDAGE